MHDADAERRRVGAARRCHACREPAADDAETFLVFVNQAAQQRRAELVVALDHLEHLLQKAQQQRDDALDALADRTLSARLRAAYADRAAAAVDEYETRLQQQHTLRAGIAALDERMRVLKATLESRLIDAARWQEPAAQQAFRRALHLLVHKAALVEVERGTYRVDLEIYTEDDLVRETVNSERTRLVWSTNTFRAARVAS